MKAETARSCDFRHCLTMTRVVPQLDISLDSKFTADSFLSLFTQHPNRLYSTPNPRNSCSQTSSSEDPLPSADGDCPSSQNPMPSWAPLLSPATLSHLEVTLAVPSKHLKSQPVPPLL